MKINSINLISGAGIVSNAKPKALNYSNYSNNTANSLNHENSQYLYSNPISMFSVKRASGPAAVITFRGSRSKDGAIFVGAELPPYWKKGGVATVMNDYPGPHVIPYYNGKIEYDLETGLPKKNGKVSVHALEDGTPIFINENLDATPIDKIVSDGNYWRLEKISEKKMHWGIDEQDDAVLYKVMPKQSDITKAIEEGKEPPSAKNHYMVFTDATAKMKVPYSDGSYSFGIKEKLPSDAAMWHGDSYAKFGKAVVETLPSILERHNMETVICSDAQSAYVPHWMAQKVLAGDKLYNELKPSYVMHNIGVGYTGATSNKNMFVNLAESVEQIEAVKKDPFYIKALMDGAEEKYFEPFVKETFDDLSKPNSSMIPLKLYEQGFVSAATTVSEEYGVAAATNPHVSPELSSMLNKFHTEGKQLGILNPLNDPSIDPYKPLSLPGYGKDQEVEINGVKETVKAMKIFSSEMTLEQMLEVKKENMKNLFNRLSGKYHQQIILTGLSNKEANLIGNIDSKWVQAIDEGKDVKLFVSWGRGDFQKGLDSVLSAFEKFAKTAEGENSVLVLGGELDAGNSESINIKNKLNSLLDDVALKGRICFMDGFAPGLPLASAGNAAVFPSRFAPCELTDLEAQKYLCTPIVTNTQGLKQKNFDPRITEEAHRATSYKTKSEYYMGLGELKKVSPEFSEKYEKLLAKFKLAFVNRKISEEKAQKLAIKEVLSGDDYQKLYREYVDKIIVDELAQAMHSKATESRETSQLLFDNHKNLKTGWSDNGALHPSGKSSWKLYEDLHINPDPQKPKKSLFTFDNKLVEALRKAKETITENTGDKSVEGAVAKGKEVAAEAKKGLSKNGKIAIAVAAAGALIAFGVYASNKKKPQTNLNSDGDEFQKSRVGA